MPKTITPNLLIQNMMPNAAMASRLPKERISRLGHHLAHTRLTSPTLRGGPRRLSNARLKRWYCGTRWSSLMPSLTGCVANQNAGQSRVSYSRETLRKGRMSTARLRRRYYALDSPDSRPPPVSLDSCHVALDFPSSLHNYVLLLMASTFVFSYSWNAYRQRLRRPARSETTSIGQET